MVDMPHNALLMRIRAEYMEMPGLRLTLEQAQRLCGIDRTLCKTALDALVEAKSDSLRNRDRMQNRLATCSSTRQPEKRCR